MVAMEKNGSIFIKLGQHLSSLNYLLPSEWCDTFIPLQDRCPVSSFESIKQMVESETGMPFEDIFSEFEQIPLGAASLAQVHRAVDKASGKKIAVKCQHPGTSDHGVENHSEIVLTYSSTGFVGSYRLGLDGFDIQDTQASVSRVRPHLAI